MKTELEKQINNEYNNKLFESYQSISFCLLNQIQEMIVKIWWTGKNNYIDDNKVLNIDIEHTTFRIWLEGGAIHILSIGNKAVCYNIATLLSYIWDRVQKAKRENIE